MTTRPAPTLRRPTLTRRSLLAAAVVPIIAGPLAMLVWDRSAPVGDKRVIVLGIDGMDYRLTAELMSQGAMPNLSALALQGSFSRLETSSPPLSPVAWSNFISGTDAGAHGVYDFLRRREQDVRDGFMPIDSVSNLARGSGWSPSAGKYILPPADRHELIRRGQAFWDVLEDAGIGATIFRAPANYPVSQTKAQVLSGMGTPDIEGGYGSYTYLTDQPADWELEPTGGRVLACLVENGIVKIKEGDAFVRPFLLGPVNRFLKSPRRCRAEFDVYVDDSRRTAAVCLQGRQAVVDQGQWSPWMNIEFELLPGVKSASGHVRFYLKKARGGVRLLASPINLGAGADGLSSGGLAEMESELGPFATQGMPELTKPLSDGIFSIEEYQAQSDLVLDEQRAQLSYLLESRKKGFLFFYLSSLDLDSHVFWGRGQSAGGETGPVQPHPRLLERYRRMDQIVGEVRRRLVGGDVLYVLSDHGFERVNRHFNLVRWLQREGYLAYARPMAERTSRCYAEVDWPLTRAYPVGFNGLYLNIRSREPQGCVAPSEYDATLERLRQRLLALRDDASGTAVFHSVCRPAELYDGKPAPDAPDLILGYAAGYGPSDESVLGTWAAATLADNKSIFTGHHLTDPRLVPGVLFSSRPLSAACARLQDVTVTILKEFGVGRPSGMTGRPLF